MGNFKPRDYLGSHPPLPPLTQAKYEPAAPSGKGAKDPKAWKEALDRAHTALEHTNIRSVLF
jgi:hypothetical protein